MKSRGGGSPGLTRAKLFWTGLAGTAITALCCFTPVLVVTLGALGLSAAVAYLDLVLLPGLAGFIGLTVYAVGLRWRHG